MGKAANQRRERRKAKKAGEFRVSEAAFFFLGKATGRDPQDRAKAAMMLAGTAMRELQSFSAVDGRGNQFVAAAPTSPMAPKLAALVEEYEAQKRAAQAQEERITPEAIGDAIKGLARALGVSFRPETIMGVTEQGADNGRATCRVINTVGASWSVLGERADILALIEHFQSRPSPAVDGYDEHLGAVDKDGYPVREKAASTFGRLVGVPVRPLDAVVLLEVGGAEWFVRDATGTIWAKGEAHCEQVAQAAAFAARNQILLEGSADA